MSSDYIHYTLLACLLTSRLRKFFNCEDFPKIQLTLPTIG